MITSDSQIRRALHSNRLRKYHMDSNTRVVDELGLHNGYARADIATINGILQGFEIKSDGDTFARLPTQINAYDSVFDKSTLVIGETHYREARQIVPSHWGILIARLTKKGTVAFLTEREAKTNRGHDSFSLAQLLWKSEAIEVIKKFGGTGRDLRGNKEELYCRLTKLLSFRELHLAVCEALKIREGWRGHQALL